MGRGRGVVTEACTFRREEERPLSTPLATTRTRPLGDDRRQSSVT